MPSEIARQAQDVTLASDTQARVPPTVLEIIAAVARDPHTDVAKLRELLDLQERIQAKDAEIEFARAMKAAQDEMPTVYRESKNDSNQSRYAKLEALDKAIRPVYTRHGFSLSFSGVQPWEVGKTRVKCIVRHIAGHSEPHELEGEPDTAGPKGGATKTAIQGMGSTVSYLRRYLTLMIFNVMLSNEDNDGNNDPLNADELNNMTNMLNGCNITGEDMQKFLMFAGARSVERIQRFRYSEVMSSLMKRHKKMQAEGKL